MMKPVTVYDIAKEANVSVATVSRVLNNTAPVKASTRERIQGLINKYQFQPNALARSLIKKATDMIGIILPDITNPFFPEVLAGTGTGGAQAGMHVLPLRYGILQSRHQGPVQARIAVPEHPDRETGGRDHHDRRPDRPV